MKEMNDQTFQLMTTSLADIKKGQTAIHTRMDESHKEIHDRITEVNGEMDVRMNAQEVWRNRVIGAVSVITAILIPVILWIAKEELNLWKG